MSHRHLEPRVAVGFFHRSKTQRAVSDTILGAAYLQAIFPKVQFFFQGVQRILTRSRMTVSPIVCVGCGIIGCVSGVASVVWHSSPSCLSCVAGGGLGCVLGIGSFFVLVFPYVGWLYLHDNDKRHPPAAKYEPPRLWSYLFLPLMLATTVLAAFLSWFAIRAFL